MFAASSVAGTGGDGNGYETNRSGLWGATNGAFASDVSSGSGSGTTCGSAARDSEVTTGYSLGSLGTTIQGVRVQVVGKVSSSGNAPKFCVQLSSDGGTTWGTGKLTGAIKTTATTFTLGTTADLWGRSWSPADFGSNFRIRIIDLANTTSRTFYLDSVSVSVTYQ